MPEGSSRSNNVRAGAFILCGLAIGISVFIILSGWNPFQVRKSYTVRFTVEQGVDGLAAGSDVKVGGLLKGMVTGILPQFAQNDSKVQQLESILVDFDVDSDVTLWSNASVTRYMPLLGGGAWLNFDSVGYPKGKDYKGGKLLEPGGELKANVTGGILATLLGPTNAERTSEALKNIDSFTAFLTDIPKAWNEDVVPMLENANTMVASLRGDYGEWSKKITTFLARADSAALKLDGTLDDIPPLLASAQKDLDHVGEILDENAPKISETMDNIVVMSQDGKVIIFRFPDRLAGQDQPDPRDRREGHRFTDRLAQPDRRGNRFADPQHLNDALEPATGECTVEADGPRGAKKSVEASLHAEHHRSRSREPLRIRAKLRDGHQ